MKDKPKIHFWMEPVEINAAKDLPSVYVINACRAWEEPAMGVFMIFRSDECAGWIKRHACQDLVAKKLEAREQALINYYGRSFKKYLDQIELTPAEKRSRANVRPAAEEHQF